MSAVAAYLRTLSKKRGVRRAQIEKQLDIKKDDIRQIEEGKKDPNVEELIKLVVACQGDLTDVQHLVLSKATDDEGERLALERLKLNTLKTQIATLDHAQLTHIIRYALDRLDNQVEADV